MHDRRAIREQRAAGGTIRGVARDVGASRNAVRRALTPGARETYHRRSIVDDEAVELAVRDVLADHPFLTVGEVGQLIGWTRSRRTLSTLVARLRPEYANRTDVAVGRLTVGTVTAGSLRAAPIEGGSVIA